MADTPPGSREIELPKSGPRNQWLWDAAAMLGWLTQTTWPDATTAIGTAAGALLSGGTVVFAGLAWRSTRKTLEATQNSLKSAEAALEIERARDRRRDEDEERAQVRQIAVWASDCQRARGRPDDGFRDVWCAKIANTSGLPIVDVSATLTFVDDDRSPATAYLPAAIPDRESFGPVAELAFLDTDVVVSDRILFHDDGSIRTKLDTVDPDLVRLTVTFKDAQSRRWRITDHSDAERLPSNAVDDSEPTD